MDYPQLVSSLRAGRRPSAAEVDRILQSAGRTTIDLVGDVLAGQRAAPRPGDRCGACEAGFLRVVTSRRRGGLVTRYLRCGGCGFGTKAVVPAESVPKRKKMAAILS